MLLLTLCSLRKGWKCSRLDISWHQSPLWRLNSAEPTPGDMKVKNSLHKAFLTHIQCILLPQNLLLICQRLAMAVYHILGSQGSKPRNECEGRMAGGKNTLSTLLLFHAVHAKIKQQLKKASISSGVALIVGSITTQVPQAHACREPKRSITGHNFFPFETILTVIVCREVG